MNNLIEEEYRSDNFTPALGYSWLTGFYDLTIKMTMPEKKVRYPLTQFCILSLKSASWNSDRVPVRTCY